MKMISVLPLRLGFRRRGYAVRAPALLAAAWLWSGCTTRTLAPVGEPVANPAEVAAEVARQTVPGSPQQITFQWTLDEAGARVRGRGVVRHEAPRRLRLDLFGPRNESFLSAALVGDDVRLPAGASANVPIPSPALLWAGLGVVRPPTSAVLESATASDSVTVLRYRAEGGDTYLYRIRGGATPRLEQLERVGSRGVIESVRLERSDLGALERARYRDWSAYRDLTLELESVKDVASFPETIWAP